MKRAQNGSLQDIFMTESNTYDSRDLLSLDQVEGEFKIILRMITITFSATDCTWRHMRHNRTDTTRLQKKCDQPVFRVQENLKPSIIIDQSITCMIVKNARNIGIIVLDPAFLWSCDRTKDSSYRWTNCLSSNDRLVAIKETQCVCEALVLFVCVICNNKISLKTYVLKPISVKTSKKKGNKLCT
jgi:hypothetical protein